MNIAFFVNRFPSVSETFILNQITGLMDHGHSVDIYANRPGGEPKLHSDVLAYGLLERTCYLLDLPSSPARRYFAALCTIGRHALTHPRVCLGSLQPRRHGESKYSLNLMHSVKHFLPRKSYDVIHCHFGHQGLRAQSLRGLGVLTGTLVTVFHGYDVSKYLHQGRRDVYERLFRDGELFLPISETWRRALIEMGCPPEKTCVHHMGIDPKRFPFTARGIGEDGQVRVASIARLVEKKGIEYGIRAVHRIRREGRRIQYCIVGDGPLRPHLERLVDDLGARDVVSLVGWKNQDEVRAVLDESHILLAPSVTSAQGDQEGIPVVLMEGLAMGLPVLSTVHSGIPELIQDGVSGFLVKEGDVDALADKLRYLVEHSDLWAKMGRAGRAFVEQHFDINKLNDQLVDLYRKLLEES